MGVEDHWIEPNGKSVVENVGRPEVFPSKVWLPAASFHVHSGSPVVGLLGGQATGWVLDDSAIERIGTQVRLHDWLTASVTIYWGAMLGGGGNVRWDLYGQTLVHDMTITTIPFLSQDVTAAGAAGQVKVKTLASTVPCTSAGITQIRIDRNGSHASDTLAGDAAIIGVLLTKVT